MQSEHDEEVQSLHTHNAEDKHATQLIVLMADSIAFAKGNVALNNKEEVHAGAGI
jgi:hypothetical protein